MNVISSSGMNSGLDRRRIISLLDSLGYGLNSILFNGCTIDEIRRAGRAEFNIPASKRDLSPEYRQMYEDHGMVVSDRLLPCGFIESVVWLRAFENDSNKDSVENTSNPAQHGIRMWSNAHPRRSMARESISSDG